jgi:putative ABC transport system substrate-binding protein
VSDWIDAFREGLRERGYIEGQNIVLDYRFSEGQDDRLPKLADELVRLPVDIVVTEAHRATMAAKEATSTIPIVISGHADPVGTGIVASLARPGGNVTGISNNALELAAKRLQLLQQVSPGISRVAVLYDHNYRPTVVLFQHMQAGAAALGLELLSFDVRSAADFAPAFASAIREHAEALSVFHDPLSFGQRNQILNFAAQFRLPTMQNERSWVDAGGLMSYGPNSLDQWRRAAYYVDRILKGARPADLPIEQPMTFDFVVNLKTAQALSITFPNEIMLQVTEVIQ